MMDRGWALARQVFYADTELLLPEALARAANTFCSLNPTLRADELTRMLSILALKGCVHAPLLELLDAQICNDPRRFDPSQSGRHLRDLGNLRTRAQAFDRHNDRFLEEYRSWSYDSITKLLWGNAAAQTGFCNEVGREVLLQRGAMLNAFHEHDDLWELQVLYNLIVPKTLELEIERRKPKARTGRRSRFEEVFAEMLGRCGRKFSEEVPIGRYSVDFEVDSDTGPVLVETQGDRYHQTIDLTRRPPCPTGIIRGEDLIRRLVLEALGHRVVFVRYSEFRTEPEMREVVQSIISGERVA